MTEPTTTEVEAAISTPVFEIADLPTVFADVEPVPQDDGPTAVCRIDYPPAFAQAFDYFRAMLHRQEYSPRALQLTSLCLGQNPANYTVWHYRRLALYAQPNWTEKIPEDLELAAELGGNNPKNYQIWYHRRAILVEFSKQGGDLKEAFAKSELEYVASVLQADGKNYHAWSHRQWLLSTLNDEALWKDEIAYTDRLIEADIRNNSAWNQRWFVTHRGKTTTRRNEGDDGSLSVGTACAEAEYALTQAAKDPYNESPFSYFLAIVKELKKTSQWKTALLPAFYEKVVALQLSSPNNPNKDPSAHVLSTRVELLKCMGDEDSIQTAQSILDTLGETVDPIRQKYYALRKSQLVQAS